MKAVYRIHGAFICPLIEADGILQAIVEAKKLVAPDDNEFVSKVMTVEKVGFMPGEFDKIGK